MKNKKTVQLSVALNENMYEDIKKLAAKRHTSMGDVIRFYIKKGLKVEYHDENEEEFRRMIHDELQVKSTKASAITMYTGLQIMSESFADDVSFARVVASASKQAGAYMKMKEKTDDEYMQDTNEILNGMKKVVRAGEE